jgi:hypothetical protein
MVVMQEECVDLGMEELNRGRAGCCLHASGRQYHCARHSAQNLLDFPSGLESKRNREGLPLHTKMKDWILGFSLSPGRRNVIS